MAEVVQPGTCPSVSVDLHRRAVGACHAVQPNQPPAATGAGLVGNSPIPVRASDSFAAPLPPPPEATGYGFMKRSSSAAAERQSPGAKLIIGDRQAVLIAL